MYLTLVPEDQVLIWTDEFRDLAKGELLTTKENSQLINRITWIQTLNIQVTDAMVCNWFNPDEGIEKHLSPASNGLNRGSVVELVVRFKLFCLWRYDKNCSTKRIHEMIYG